MQGGPLNHVIAAKAACFLIASSEPFRRYQESVRANADVLAETLQEGGLDVLTGGTDTHLLLVDLRSTEWTGKDAEERLAVVGITVNRNTVPFDELAPTVASGFRVGTPAPTIRGFDEDDFGRSGGSCAMRSGLILISRRWPREAPFCERDRSIRGKALSRPSGRASSSGWNASSSHVGHRNGDRGDSSARAAQARVAQGRSDDHADVPPAGERAYASADLRGDQADLADEEIEIETPLEVTAARRISGKKVAVCPILRAGARDARRRALAGSCARLHRAFRDEETLEPFEYFGKLPGDIADRDVILLDPMLATGNSTAAAIETVKRAGATSIRLIALIAAPEGIARVHGEHPGGGASSSPRSTAVRTTRGTSSRASATQATGCTGRRQAIAG